MQEVRSLEWIERNAREAAERFDRAGAMPANPFAPETDAHKEWTRVYYESSSKDRAAQAA